MTSRNRAGGDNRHVALCYIRQSYTRDANDTNSPQRQRANIQAVCDRYGWTPEWYVDAEGHKSGRNEKNRPSWLALKARLGDPDVVALVANDLARLHRKSWHVGRTMEMLDDHGVRLVFAAPGRDLDTSTPAGRMMINFLAMQDEAYANDVAQRSKDSIAYRKNRGITVGIPPFGTVRDDEGYLIPTSEGAWQLPDGTFIAGETDEKPPHPDAIWRGYYACTQRVLEIYSENRYGYNRIAEIMTGEGWMFRDRWGNPRLISSDDIRRITSNWRQYAGIVPDGRSKDNAAYNLDDPASELFNTGRAVFPLQLLKTVAAVQAERSVRTRPFGQQKKAFAYPLIRLLFCAHCEKLADDADDSKKRTRLTGNNQRGKTRYRHAEGIQCGTQARSVPTHLVEQDVLELVNLLTLKPEAMEAMLELAVQSESGLMDEDPDVFEAQKRATIAKYQRKIEAARFLFEEGDMSREDFLKRKDDSERMIAHWEARTTEVQKKAIELTACLEAVNRLRGSWEAATNEERQMLARNLFQHIVYDLDRRRIVDFRLHAWADHYLMLRSDLYDDPHGGGTSNSGEQNLADEGEPVVENKNSTAVSSSGEIYAPNGVRRRKRTQRERGSAVPA